MPDTHTIEGLIMTETRFRSQVEEAFTSTRLSIQERLGILYGPLQKECTPSDTHSATNIQDSTITFAG